MRTRLVDPAAGDTGCAPRLALILPDTRPLGVSLGPRDCDIETDCSDCDVSLEAEQTPWLFGVSLIEDLLLGVEVLA